MGGGNTWKWLFSNLYNSFHYFPFKIILSKKKKKKNLKTIKTADVINRFLNNADILLQQTENTLKQLLWELRNQAQRKWLFKIIFNNYLKYITVVSYILDFNLCLKQGQK